ncbi:unnamed protein product [Paramecium primaurelia]|uniref:AB hydrolase-1 domain-containing protein n=1 Tax=Paramecium primaurelia TaxID=5886 RepID=A0A8S1LCS3_PARPR|nr:unnamed protein product [Paramecium primaurelia]
MFSSLSAGYDDLWKAIIRPPRDNEYTEQDLGPSQFKIQGVLIKRTDFQIKNKRGLKLECSFFEPVKKPCEQLPCVIYLHGNSSSRLECLPSLDGLLQQYIQVFSFDFAGCGKSEGEYISLGWYERDDVEVVVDWLRQSNKVSTIGLWGRSMGAVTALMHADRDPSIAGLVLDSAFSNLKTLAEELAKQYAQKVPSFAISAGLSMIRKTIQSKANFDIENINPLKNHVSKAFIPAFFIAADEDTFVLPHHTKKLHEAYAGDKNISIVPGDHNSKRPSFAMNSIAIFFYNTLQVKYLVPEYKPDLEKPDNTFQNDEANFLYRYQNHVGNAFQVQGAMNDFDDDEELRRAIEESLKITNSDPNQQNQQNSQNRPQVQPYKQPEDLLKFSDDESLL